MNAGSIQYYNEPTPHTGTEKTRDRQYIGEELSNLSKTELPASIVFAPEKIGTFRFCVDYSKLIAVAIWYFHPEPRMNKCIDSLGDARVFRYTARY